MRRPTVVRRHSRNIAGADGEKVSVGTQVDPSVEVNAVNQVASRGWSCNAKEAEGIQTSGCVGNAWRVDWRATRRRNSRAGVQASNTGSGISIRLKEQIQDSRYEMLNGLLRWVYTNESGREAKQLVVPKKLRTKLLSIAYDAVLMGHMGIKKTSDRILADLFWPGLTADVTRWWPTCSSDSNKKQLVRMDFSHLVHPRGTSCLLTWRMEHSLLNCFKERLKTFLFVWSSRELSWWLCYKKVTV